MLILRNCKLVPLLTEGTDLVDADIALSGGKIKKIAPCKTVFDGEGEEIEEMDLAGKNRYARID